ncbi:vitamin K epoxide reductase family protein [Saccharopolyspora rhizosphaerae]|uniref:Vitamin K epoxide reductase family protein n=1 Tax=Saccharopolyspora rhizosphaerae TaxID=2492662 RepID=A0A3R8R4U4_9PSEU|nr:vitamin K epoxide reductase family protein [Saccharopolyspora rhizosphaerae]RRO18369.1 vitamin K epoxide reductase family protein [Saccharopolyspora rhizosphaerae]
MTTAHAVEETAGQEPRASARPRGLAWLYVVGGAIGFVASFALIVEKVAKLVNPDHVLSCSLNPIVSCGSVMDSPQAALLGFPNPLIGVAAFPVVVASGVALLAGFRPPRWYWWGLQVGTTLAVVFIHWLIVQSLYSIGALCPYCMVVWAVTIPLFWYTTLRNLREGHLGSAGRSLGSALGTLHTVVVVVWYLVIVALILQRFWDYWTSL